MAKLRTWGIFLSIILISLSFTPPAAANKDRVPLPAGKPVVWHNPDNISARDLRYGPQGISGMPRGPFKLIKVSAYELVIRYIEKLEKLIDTLNTII